MAFNASPTEDPIKYAIAKIDLTQDALRNLWDQQKIGIHWEDIPLDSGDSIDKAQYEKERGDSHRGMSADINAFNTLNEQGGFVCAYYGSDTDNRDGIEKDKVILGEIEAHSSDSVDLEDSSGTDRIIKTLQIQNSTVLKQENYPRLFSGEMPRQGSIRNANNVRGLLESILINEPLDHSLESVSPAQVEVACEEYLRNELASLFKTYPSGGQLKNVDIVGKADNISVMAQVTKGSGTTLENKFEPLERISDETNHIFLFGSSELEDTVFSDESADSVIALNEWHKRDKPSIKPVIYGSLNDVLVRLDDHERTNSMVDEMLSYPHLE